VGGMMSDLGETFKEYRKMRKEKKIKNIHTSLDILDRNEIDYKILSMNGPHILVEGFDYWASTGLFINRKTKKRGRGIFNLLKLINCKIKDLRIK
jgi:hypothetical protein